MKTPFAWSRHPALSGGDFWADKAGDPNALHGGTDGPPEGELVSFLNLQRRRFRRLRWVLLTLLIVAILAHPVVILITGFFDSPTIARSPETAQTWCEVTAPARRLVREVDFVGLWLGLAAWTVSEFMSAVTQTPWGARLLSHSLRHRCMLAALACEVQWVGLFLSTLWFSIWIGVIAIDLIHEGVASS